MAIEGIAVPTLVCERLILQPLSAAHSAGMFAMWSQAAVCAYSGAALDWRGERPGCRDVEAFIEPANKTSIRLATRLGLRTARALSGGAERYAMSLAEGGH